MSESSDAPVGRVTAVYQDLIQIDVLGREILAACAGKLRKSTEMTMPAVGDMVRVRIGEGDGRALVEEILPRKSALSRVAAGSSGREQIIAANADFVFLVT